VQCICTCAGPRPRGNLNGPRMQAGARSRPSRATPSAQWPLGKHLQDKWLAILRSRTGRTVEGGPVGGVGTCLDARGFNPESLRFMRFPNRTHTFASHRGAFRPRLCLIFHPCLSQRRAAREKPGAGGQPPRFLWLCEKKVLGAKKELTTGSITIGV